MNFTFIRNGDVVFVRSDAEQAEWTQEEMSALLTFPFKAEKRIERGMTVLFQDPDIGDWHAFEVRNLQNFTAEGYQQLTAEHIVIAELTDCHISAESELTNVTAAAAVTSVLTGTGWSVGNNYASGTSSGDISRGSVWEAISTIRSNWNVHIVPRVTVNANGISGRYLDIFPPQGTWRGLRLSVERNTADPCVTYDDSELFTALYAYGGTKYTEGTDPDTGATTQTTEEVTIAGVTWEAVDGHPAKPANQLYLEWPEKTTLYGRNGRARFGYYQNSDIKDANILIQKTWEALQACCNPKVSVTGTVADLTRLGYVDVPMRIYDMAVVDVDGDPQYKQITQLTVDLLDPTRNRPNIGDYIPNIIYISRETEHYATGGRKSNAGGDTKSKKKRGEFETSIYQNERTITLKAVQIDTHGEILRQAGMSIDPITGTLIYATDSQNNIGSMFNVQASAIAGEVTARQNDVTQLTGRLLIQADKAALMVEAKDARGIISCENMSKFPTTGDATKIYLDVATGKYYEWKNGAYAEIAKTDLNKANVAEIVTEINENNETQVRINAQKILIGSSGSNVSLADALDITTYGNEQVVKVKKPLYLESKNMYINGGNLTVSPLSGSGGTITGHDIHVGTSGSLIFNDRNDESTCAIQRADALGLLDSGGHVALTSSGDTYTLWYLPANIKKTVEISTPSVAGGWVNCGTFSRATSLSGVWSSGKITVTASPQGETFEELLASGAAEWANDYKSVQIPINATWGSSGQYSESTGWKAYLITTPAYNAGQNATAVTLSWEHTGDYTSADHNRIQYATNAPTPVTGGVEMYVTQDSNWTGNKKGIYIRTGSNVGTIRAKAEVNASTLVSNAQAATGVSIDQANGEIKREYSSSTKSVSITAKATLSYDISTHKYSANAKARAGANNLEMDSDDDDEDEAQGYIDGQDSIINAGESVSRTTNGTETLNKYVTTLTINVPGGVTPDYALTKNDGVLVTGRSTPSGYTAVSGRSYFKKDNTSGANTEVIFYYYTTPVVDGRTLNSPCTIENYFTGISSVLYQDGYSSGYNSGWDYGAGKAWIDYVSGAQLTGKTDGGMLDGNTCICPRAKNHNNQNVYADTYFRIPQGWLYGPYDSIPAGGQEMATLAADKYYCGASRNSSTGDVTPEGVHFWKAPSSSTGPKTYQPEDIKWVSGWEGTSLGTLSGAAPGKYLRMTVGNTDYTLMFT